MRCTVRNLAFFSSVPNNQLSDLFSANGRRCKPTFIMFGRRVNVSLQSKLLSFHAFHALLRSLVLELIFSSLSSYTCASRFKAWCPQRSLRSPCTRNIPDENTKCSIWAVGPFFTPERSGYSMAMRSNRWEQYALPLARRSAALTSGAYSSDY